MSSTKRLKFGMACVAHSWILACASPAQTPAPVSTPVVDPGSLDCGWSPSPEGEPDRFRERYFGGVGCGLAPETGSAWRSVVELRPAAVEIQDDGIVVQFVLLDAQKRRVLPYGRSVQYRLGRYLSEGRGTGKAELREARQHDGVFRIQLPPTKAVCPVFVLRFYNGKRWLELRVDHWLFTC
jgi:hypothetical protein